MKYEAMTTRVSMMAALALGSAGLALGATKEQIAIEKEGIQLIRQLEDVGRSVHYNADQLKSFFRGMDISQWSHSHHLHEIKVLVNEGLQPALTRLSQIQPQLPEWKQESIDKMLDAARNLAADTNSAIVTRNETGNTPAPSDAEYKGLVSRINDHAEILVKTADAASTYAQARRKVDEAGLAVSKK